MDSKEETPDTSTPRSGVQQSTSKTSVVSTGLDHLKFFSGNPHIEKTNGILHFYKNRSALDIMNENCAIICMAEIPAHVTCSELVRFISPAADKIVEAKIVRDSSPNQYFVVIKFKTPTDAFSFYQEYNGLRFNSLENAFCTLLFVEKIETTEEGGEVKLSGEGTSELPTCAVCLERMEFGVLTILCNHSFHSECLEKWEDSTCPVCRFNQTPELIPDQTCSECGKTTDLWMCLICGNIGCGRYAGAHAYTHFETTSHTFTKSLGQDLVWDYVADNFVHRLIQSSIDGKMVELQGSDMPKSEENETNELEVAQLFSTQMETQRLFFEDKLSELKGNYLILERSSESRIRELEKKWATVNEENETLKQKLTTLETEKTHLDKKSQKSQQIIRKLQSELDEEKQMSKMLCDDKQTMMTKYKELEYRLTMETKNLQEQVNDLMSHFEAQTRLNDQISKANITADEVQTGNVVLEKAQQSSKKGQRRK